MKFDEKIYFDMVRETVFGGAMNQGQVNGQKFILAAWEHAPPTDDLRHLAYPLSTAKHETASTMLPIAEYGKGQGREYGKTDPETGQAYYGRGFCQLTWRNNYAKATDKLGLTGADDLELHADRALDPTIAANIMFRGMTEGWFRTGGGKPETLARYFDADTDDAFNAREIINGDRNIVPNWSGGKSIGKVIAEYHDNFLAALQASVVVAEPEPEPLVVTVRITAPPGVVVKVEQS